MNFKISVSITFEETENGDVILQEETMVLHSRYLPTSRWRDTQDEESMQDEACDNDDDNNDDDDHDDDDNDDDDDDGVAGEKKLERQHLGRTRLYHLQKKKNAEVKFLASSIFELDRNRMLQITAQKKNWGLHQRSFQNRGWKGIVSPGKFPIGVHGPHVRRACVGRHDHGDKHYKWCTVRVL